MNITECLSCGARTENPKFCSSACSAKHNNRLRRKIHIRKCAECRCTFKGYKLVSKFCSLACSAKNRRRDDYNKFLEDGGAKFSESYSPKSFKPFFLEEQGGVCAICKNLPIWNGGRLVLILDHIDGNASNNHRTNLRLVCPNCDSQLSTFKSKNKGKGRHFRRIRIKEGKSY